MKNLDLLSKRILVISISITMVLCSASLFVYSTNTATAANTATGAPVASKAMMGDFGTMSQEWPMGIANGNAYFMEDNQGTWAWAYKPLSSFKAAN